MQTASATVACSDALAALGAGAMVVLRGDDGPAASGFLVVAAEAASAEAINFMAREGRGLICLALTPERCEELGLELIPARGVEAPSKEFTVSIEADEGVTTGISASDRARTIAVAIDPACGSTEICSPGHVFPLRARPGGLLERPGEAEAAVALARLADLQPAAVLCEILGEDGRLARGQVLRRYCERYGLQSVSIPELLERVRPPWAPLERELADLPEIEFDRLDEAFVRV
jgi:3,4-dihydroxy 2-butanone 4-phosphate synthase/GTP cyclohydrolase II